MWLFDLNFNSPYFFLKAVLLQLGYIQNFRVCEAFIFEQRYNYMISMRKAIYFCHLKYFDSLTLEFLY